MPACRNAALRHADMESLDRFHVFRHIFVNGDFMNLILFDDPDVRSNLLPLTFTRPVAEMRVGIIKIAEKWERHFTSQLSYATQPYLSRKFQTKTATDNFWINRAVGPD